MRRSDHPQPDPVGPGQESVWDYPRPPRLERTSSEIVVVLGDEEIARTTPDLPALRVLETSHPPTYYLPIDDFRPGALRAADGASWCEWKGHARYYDVLGGDRVAPRAAWTYPEPTAGFRPLAGAVAVMAAQMDRCTVDGEEVSPQPGGFYGGWITSRVAGPFKGVPGTRHW
jgi:uncharacterized protein (DUF427 family)